MNVPNTNNSLLPIVDRFGRKHKNLRIGVTDRCNIRCFYCMPLDVKFLPRKDLLTFEEITRIVKSLVPLGVDRLRITGGEPLVRFELHKLIKFLRDIDGVNDIAMTTNGILLAKHAEILKKSGLDRLNISLDTLDPARFEQIARRKGLDQVLEGITVAQEVGFSNIRINAVSIAGITDTEIIPLAHFARERNLELRFIEFMPLDGDNNWESPQVLHGSSIRKTIEKEFGPLVEAGRTQPSQPAMDYRFADGIGKIGFINPVSEPFCSTCDRLRVTSEGKLRNCLFSTAEWDVREILRNGASDLELQSLVRECIAAKKAGHGIDKEGFQRPSRAMYQIGG